MNRIPYSFPRSGYSTGRVPSNICMHTAGARAAAALDIYSYLYMDTYIDVYVHIKPSYIRMYTSGARAAAAHARALDIYSYIYSYIYIDVYVHI